MALISSYIVARQADDDLVDIWRFSLDNWGARQADRYTSLIFMGNSVMSLRSPGLVKCGHIQAGKSASIASRRT